VSVRRAAALAVVLGAVLAAVLLRSGGDGNPTVATVTGEPITRKQLDAVVDHFRLEAEGEGKQFPDEGSAAFDRLRNRLLGLLVYRTELRQAAARLGVRVTPVEVVRRLQGSAEPGEAARDSFEYGSVEAQILYERIFERVTRGVTAPNQAELAARRNQAMSRYVARLERETKVRYEPGYAPGP
jgi:SurA N-terminal domain